MSEQKEEQVKKPKRNYFDKRGKTPEQIAEHERQKKEKHKQTMRESYKRKKIDKNNEVRAKFMLMYAIGSEMGGGCNIKDIEDSVEICSANKYVCMCFDKIYETFITSIEQE